MADPKSTSPPASKKSKSVPAKTQKPPASARHKSKEIVSDSSGSEEDEESEEKEDEEESSEDEDEDEDEAPSEPTKNTPPVSNFPAYAPPLSFTPVSSSDVPTANPFSAANLKGKELWFITAPASAPLSKLHHINPASVLKRQPVLQLKNGREFALKIDDDDGARDVQDGGVNVLVPDSKGSYRIAGQKVVRSFRMVEAPPKPPKTSEDSVPKSKAVREQPEGLRMRYKPFGAEESKTEDGENHDVEMMDVDSSPKARRVSGGNEEGRTKKRHKVDFGDDGETKKKKHKNKEKYKSKDISVEL